MEGRYNMGTNTLVKEFVGRKDHKDYIKRGTAVENLLVEEGLRRGYTVTPSSEKQNMYDHIDLILTKGDKKFTVDVKARRTGTDKSKGFDDLWTVVEFKNTMGDAGWLYSKSDYIVWDGMFTDKELKNKAFWGHSSIEQGVEFFHNSGIENMLITHHDPSRTDDQLNVLSKELPKGIIFAKDGMIVDFT